MFIARGSLGNIKQGNCVIFASYNSDLPCDPELSARHCLHPDLGGRATGRLLQGHHPHCLGRGAQAHAVTAEHL